MECQCIRWSELPHTSKLFAAYLDEFSRAAGFYAHPPTLDGLRSAAAGLRDFDAGVRAAVVAALREQNRAFSSDAATQRNLDRLAAGAVAIVTGQQVGLFSGPSYSFYKALSAVRWAEELTKSGTEAVPVFWLATEDHDAAEVSRCSLLDRQGELHNFEVQISEGRVGSSVGEIAFGAEIVEIASAASELLGGPGDNPVAQAVAESYRPGETFGSAFAKLLARVLRGRGLILLDPLDARLRRLASAVLRRALEENDALIAGLLARKAELEGAGFHAQVKVTPRATLLFESVDGRRLPLRKTNQGFVADAPTRQGSGGRQRSRDGLLRSIESSPEQFTPNVLLRPVVQDALLPTAACVAGPAEIAYFAQAAVLYQRLLGRMPAILPRASFTLVEPHVARLLKKYRLEIGDVARGRQHLGARLEQESLPKNLARRFAAGEKKLRAALTSLGGPLATLDPTLLGALGTAEKKMLFQFLKLRAKAGRAENFCTGVLDRQERVMLNSLYPHRGLQERTVCFLSFLARHGPALLDALQDRAATDISQHKILQL